MTSFKLNVDPQMLRFLKLTSQNLKIEKLPFALAT